MSAALARLLLLGLLAAPALAVSAPAWAGEDSSPSSSLLRPAAKRLNGLGDPSENVKELAEAGKQRQDDLRNLTKELFDAKLHVVETKLQATIELLKASTDRLESEAKLRAEFSTVIRDTETQRVNAIRLVDVGAGTIANERAIATANTLAKTVQDTATLLSTQAQRQAEDLQKLVKTTADEANRNLQQQFTAVQTQFGTVTTRLTALEQAGSEGRGRQSFQDPQLADAVKQMAIINQRSAATAGSGEGKSDLFGYIVAGAGIIFGALMVFMASRRQVPVPVVAADPMLADLIREIRESRKAAV